MINRLHCLGFSLANLRIKSFRLFYLWVSLKFPENPPWQLLSYLFSLIWLATLAYRQTSNDFNFEMIEHSVIFPRSLFYLWNKMLWDKKMIMSLRHFSFSILSILNTSLWMRKINFLKLISLFFIFSILCTSSMQKNSEKAFL